MEFEGRARIRPGFDIAPLVDVVFLLHIFFLLTMTYMAPQILDVTVPSSQAGAPAHPDAVVVVLDRNDQVTLDGESLAPGALRSRLASRFAGEQPPPAEVAADEHASVRGMVALLDILRAAGARDVSVLSRPATESQPAP
jgi:biopolymer transport protein ExbD